MAPATVQRYWAAATFFMHWLDCMNLSLAQSDVELDWQAGCFLEYLWETGQPKGTAGDVLSGIQHFLRRKRFLTGSWDLFKAWTKMELPSRAPPMPELIAAALAGMAISSQAPCFGAAILLGFTGFLRPGEILMLRQDLVHFD